MYIPAARPDISQLEKSFLQEAVNSEWISSTGSFLERSASHFSRLIQLPYVNLTSNGTTALQLALATLEIETGAEVIIPDITFGAVANSVVRSGLKPVFCNVDANTLCVTPEKISEVLTKKTKAVILVHTYGYPVDVRPIANLCRNNNLFLIEDWAEALGSTRIDSAYDNNFMKIHTYSFYANKIITSGEGGCLATNSKSFFSKSLILKNHGVSRVKYFHEEAGFNFRMTNLSAAILLAQIIRFNQMLEKRLLLTKKLNSVLENSQHLLTQSKMITLDVGVAIAPWVYPVFGSRHTINRVKEELTKSNIETRPLFTPLHAMPAYENLVNEAQKNKLSKASAMLLSGLILPLSSNFSDDEVEYYLRYLRKAVESFG